ncbi:MAG TPA: DNRLRE domain-containing protein [Micromonosporaceae bacterium]
MTAVLSTLVVAAVVAAMASAVVAATPNGSLVSVAASDDSYVRPGLTGSAGSSGSLIVGGLDVAVTYLKFDVTSLPSGSGRMTVSLDLRPVRLANMSVPSVVDVRTVANTDWSEDTLTYDDAPQVGPVIGAAVVGAGTTSFHVDVSLFVGRTGVYAFALTAPVDSPTRVFVSKESGGGPQLELSRAGGGGPTPTPTPTPTQPGNCSVGAKLVPTCGVLLGVAQSQPSSTNRAAALTDFETQVQHGQPIYHAYHRGISSFFPSPDEIDIANQPDDPHILFVNWKPSVASWASIASGNPAVDRYLDRLAIYIKGHYTAPFFFTIHHEPENDVIERPGSGYTAADYAAMYRYVVLRLRGDGVTNLVTVMDYMAYAPWNVKPWFSQLYPGDDVVDWVGWDMYGYSTPNRYGFGDFAEMLTRGGNLGWPGVYSWATQQFPDKPLMIAEWGVWYGSADPTHQAAVFGSVGAELSLYPQIKAMVYYDTPNANGRSSLIDATPAALAAFRAMCQLPEFQVSLTPPT